MGRSSTASPAICRSSGRASSSKDTSADTGLPGSPRRGTPSTEATANGLAGRMAICSHRASSIRSSTSFTTSASPMLTPPEVSRTSQRVAPARRAAATESVGVADPPEVDRHGAGLRHRGEEHGPVRVADLPRAQAPRRLDQLVAGRQHADARAGHDRHLGAAERGQHPDERSGDPGAGPDDDRARGDVVGRAADVLARLDGCEHRDRLVVATGAPGRSGVLDGHDGVGPGGHGRARHDPDRLARPDRPLGGAAGTDRVDHLQHDGQLRPGVGDVDGAHGEAVHGRAGEAREVGRRLHVLGQHTATGPRHGQPRRTQRPASGQDQVADLRQRQHRGERYRSGALRPDLGPTGGLRPRARR